MPHPLSSSISRRALLAGSSAAGLAALASPAIAKAPMLGTQAPAFYRFRIGAFEATVVSDGPLALGEPKPDMFVGLTKETITKSLTDSFIPVDNVVLEQNALVVNTGDKLVLFDTGTGSDKTPFGPKAGRLKKNLAAAGIDPKDIDAVAITHAHPDHCWGLMGESATRNFPNAQIYLAQSDLEFWTDEGKKSIPFVGGFIDPTRAQLLPNRDRIVFVKDGQEIVPGIQAMAAPGHTVGHTVFMITSQGKTICNAADLAHHHVLTMQTPKMEFAFDTDAKQGAATRIRVFDMLAAQRIPLLAYHFPWPGIGHVAKRGEGYAYVATPQVTAL
jgi:glyoxylase-like metal-dependent hydrolase (beta-lactamase superfamily II)